LKVAHQWQPLLSRLSQEAGISIELKAYRTMKAFEEALSRGEPDFVFLNPYQQIVANRRSGYVPLVRSGQDLLVGILVVPTASPIKSVKDLEGKEIAFPSPNAFAASMCLRAYLERDVKIHFTPRYVHTHDNVYRTVIMGLTQAGGGVQSTFESELPDVKRELRIIYQMPGVTPHPIAAHPRVPLKIRTQFSDAILRLWNDESERHLLIDVKMDRPILADFRRDYRPLEKLHLERFYTPIDE
jgi:phosphonate transport system substrate-binding protein